VSNEVTDFLRKEAKRSGHDVFNEVSGSIELDAMVPIKQTSGSVYGIFARSDVPISPDINKIEGQGNLYPIYWGKDISPPKRIGAHVKNYKNTGNAKLKDRPEIKGKELLFGAIFVSDYKTFEKYLHDNFKPLIGSSRAGKSSSIIEITG
jgi:hypothetical protein